MAGGQSGESVSRREVGPPQRNLALAAFLVDEAHSLFAAVFFAGEDLKLTTGERVKRMRDPKRL